MFQTRLIEEDLSSQIFETIQVVILGLPLISHRNKCHLDVAPQKVTKYNIGKGVVPLLKGCKVCKI
jgi:hypothetical protein